MESLRQRRRGPSAVSVDRMVNVPGLPDLDFEGIQDMDEPGFRAEDLRARSSPEMADIDMSEIYPRLREGEVEDLSRLRTLNNYSGLAYDDYVSQLRYKETGCYQKGALPMPLAKGDECQPGWYCEQCPAIGSPTGKADLPLSQALIRTSTILHSTALPSHNVRSSVRIRQHVQRPKAISNP